MQAHLLRLIGSWFLQTGLGGRGGKWCLNVDRLSCCLGLIRHQAYAPASPLFLLVGHRWIGERCLINAPPVSATEAICAAAHLMPSSLALYGEGPGCRSSRCMCFGEVRRRAPTNRVSATDVFRLLQTRAILLRCSWSPPEPRPRTNDLVLPCCRRFLLLGAARRPPTVISPAAPALRALSVHRPNLAPSSCGRAPDEALPTYRDQRIPSSGMRPLRPPRQRSSGVLVLSHPLCAPPRYIAAQPVLGSLRPRSAGIGTLKRLRSTAQDGHAGNHFM